MKRNLSLGLIYGSLLALFAGYWIVLAVAPVFHETWLQGEDHIVEWITVIGFIGAAITAFSLLKQRKKMRPVAIAYFVLLGIFFFVCAGEEISWGQRLLGFETPESVAKMNEQGEFNVHNLAFENFHPKDIVSWFMKTFGIILPFILFWFYREGDSAVWRYLPAPTVIPCFLFPELINAMETTLEGILTSRLAEAGLTMGGKQIEELMEMYWGLGILVGMLFIRAAWKKQEGD